MMIRSAPPASAHLADRPGAGPGADDGAAGRPGLSQPLPRLIAVHRAPPRNSSSRAAMATANAASLMCASISCTSTDGASVSRSAGEQRRVGGRVGERATLAGEGREPAQRHEQRDRAGGGRELGAHPAAELRALLRRGAHQRDARVVHVEAPVRELLGHGVARAEVDHVQRTERDDLRHAAPAGGLEPVRSGGQHAADQVVGQLRRRQVEDAGDQPGLDQALHRPAAGAGRVEDEHLVAAALQLLPRRGDRRRGDAEHGGRDDAARLRRGRPAARGDHARHRGGRVGEDPRGDRVQSGDVGDRRHQRHVADVDVGGSCRRRPWSRPRAWAPPRAAPAWPRVAIAVLPDPPAARTPWQRPSSKSRRTTSGAAAHIASTAAPRSVRAPRSNPPAAATSSRDTSAGVRGGPCVPTSTSEGGDAGRVAAGRAGTRTPRPWCPGCRRGRRSGGLTGSPRRHARGRLSTGCGCRQGRTRPQPERPALLDVTQVIW